MILVVDDEASVLTFVRRVLESDGYVTAPVGSAAEALALAPTLESIDLLLTDLMMPAMNGDELARQLRLQHPDLKVLYFTGFSDRLFAEKGQLWDGEAFLDKPCSVKGLLEAVSLLLSDHVAAPDKLGRAKPTARRPPRVAVARARVQLGPKVAADVVNVSRTGVLVRLGQELSVGSEWPMTLEWPNLAPVQLQGRVVRSQLTAIWLPDGELQSQYEIALAFVDPSPAVVAALNDVCQSIGQPC